MKSSQGVYNEIAKNQILESADMPEEPLVSIVIVNYNGSHLLGTCLGSLKALTYPRIETILVDNGSSDGSNEFVREYFPGVKIIQNKTNLGFAVAANQGIEASRGDFVAMLNNDTRVDKDWIANLVKAASADTMIGSCASKQMNFFNPEKIDSAGIEIFRGGYPKDRGRYEKDTGQFNTPVDIFGAPGASAFYRRAMLDEIGLFDGDYFAYCEEFDLSFRSHLYGWRCVYVPDAVVYHMGGQTRSHEDKRFLVYYVERNRLLTIIKNYPLRLFLHYLPFFLKYELDILIRFIRRFEIEVLKARLDALKLVPKMLKKRRLIQKHRKVSVYSLHRLVQRERT